MDDYAHHPSEIRATLNAVKGIYPERRTVVIYQPHRFTRTAKFAGDIAAVLDTAEKSFILPVYSAGEKECPHSSSQEIIRLSKKNNIKPVDFSEALTALKNELRSGDILLTMGAGDVYRIGEKFLAMSHV